MKSVLDLTPAELYEALKSSDWAEPIKDLGGGNFLITVAGQEFNTDILGVTQFEEALMRSVRLAIAPVPTIPDGIISIQAMPLTDEEKDALIEEALLAIHAESSNKQQEKNYRNIQTRAKQVKDENEIRIRLTQAGKSEREIRRAMERNFKLKGYKYE